MKGKLRLLTILILHVLSTDISEASMQFLLFAEADSYGNGRILRCSPDSSGSLTSLPLSNIVSPVALDYDAVEDRVYWTDVSRQTISRSFLNGSMQEVIIYIKVHTPDGLAVDRVGRNLYWTDTGTDKLEVSKLDGSYRKALITSGLDEPRDIILDVSSGIMYWTDWGLNPKIEKADMTGKQRLVLVNSLLHWPNGLTLDKANNRLYWVDAYFDKLEYLNLITHVRVTLISSSATLPHPFGLTLLGDYLFWTDWGNNIVYRANKESGGEVTAFITGINRPMDIHAYNLDHAAQGNSSCQINNDGCSHLCLLSSSGSVCECPGYLTLKEDGKTCKFDANKYLLFADAGNAYVFIKSLDVTESEAFPVSIPPHFKVMRPVALDMDVTDNMIYWTDLGLKTISRVSVTGFTPEVILSVNVSSPEGLAVDSLGRNIYWTDSDLNTIEVSKLDGSMRKILIKQDLDKPRDIILDVYKGLMYWCDWGVVQKIEFANMDGSNRGLLVSNNLLWPNGLTLDYTNSWLYWVDAGYQALEYYDLARHTRARLPILSLFLPHPFGLTLLEDYVYWTDWTNKGVLRTEKASPQYPTVVVSGLNQPMDIHAFDKNQSLPDHPCSFSFGGCSHLCLIRPDGYGCSCPDHLAHDEVCFSFPITSTSTPVSLSISTSASLSVSASGSQSVSLSKSSSVSPSASPSISLSVSQSVSPFDSLSVSRSLSPSISPSLSPSVSLPVSQTVSRSISPLVLPSASLSLSSSISLSVSSSVSSSVSPSVSPSDLLSVSPSVSSSASLSMSSSVSPSLSPSMSLSVSPLLSPSVSLSVSPSKSLSVSPSASSSVSSSDSLSVSPSISLSVSPSLSPSVSLSVSLSKSLSASPSVSPSLSSSISPPVSSSVSPSASSSVSSSESLSVSPSLSPSISPSVSPSLSTSVSLSVSPSKSLSVSPSVSPSLSSSISLSVSSSVSPSASSSVSSSDSLSVSPSVSPLSPSISLSVLPLESPSVALSALLSLSSSVSPSVSPSIPPSVSPLVLPSISSVSSSVTISVSLSVSPSVSITASQSGSPSDSPSNSLSASPSDSSSVSASASPSVLPSVLPSLSPLVPPITPLPQPSCQFTTCKNGGTCIVPGYFCNCERFFAWHDCSVNVASSVLEMTLTLLGEDKWNQRSFQIAIADACSIFFCKSRICTSPTGRTKRSEKGAYFQFSDVIIIGTSFAEVNSLNVEFTVLLPSYDEKAPKVTPAKDIIQMVEEYKQSIESVVGGTIQSVEHKEEVEDRPTEKPSQPEDGARSTDEKGPSVGPIAAGVGVTFVVMAMLMGFVVYKMRRKNMRKPNVTKMESEFENPAYQGEPIYDIIPENTANYAPETLSQEAEPSRQVLRNESSREQYASLRGGQDPRYESMFLAGQVQQRLKQNKNLAKSEKNYMMLEVMNAQGKTTYDATASSEIRYMKPVVGHYATSRLNFEKNDEKTVDWHYENAQYSFGNYQDQIARDMSGADVGDEDYLKPMDWHYAIPRRNGATERAHNETPFSEESQV